MVFVALTLGGQECFYDVTVQRRGNVREAQRSQMIVPRANFTCSGIITGITVSLHRSSTSGSLPYIQVWRLAQNRNDEYNKVAEVQLVESSLQEANDYWLANMTLSTSNRMAFQAGDVIGYYHPAVSFYVVWSIDTIGYTTYIKDEEDNLLSTIRLSETLSTPREQPLIQFAYILGKYSNQFTMHTYDRKISAVLWKLIWLSFCFTNNYCYVTLIVHSCLQYIPVYYFFRWRCQCDRI